MISEVVASDNTSCKNTIEAHGRERLVVDAAV
jgi:hypothetical protein